MNTENLSHFYDRCKRELTDFWELFQLEKEFDDTILKKESESPYRVLFLETLYTYRIT